MSPSSAAGGRAGQPPREAGRANPGLASRFRDVRGATCRLCDPLAPEDCVMQSMTDASPTKWHLAHTTWFFETFVLERALSDHCPFHPQFRVLFNSYYNAVGKQYPRPRRGLLTRPTLNEVWSYREHVDERMERLLEGGVAPSLAAARVPPEGHFVEDGCLHPASAGEASQHPVQLFGDVWEWTRSSYGPYPGYRVPEGALGEYNAKFMSNQMVLRGGSCVTPRSHIRATYRNFLFPEARWQFSGIRLARDVG